MTKQLARHYGFTLLELMIVLIITAILVAIAIPSYQRYSLRAAQAQVKADMLNIAEQLENYRGKQLSYINFILGSKYSATNGIYNIPSGTTDSTYKYKITLVDSVLPTGGNRVPLDNTSAAGRGWVLIATPQQSSNVILKRANYFMLTSAGVRCMTPESTSSKTYSLDKNSLVCEDAIGW